MRIEHAKSWQKTITLISEKSIKRVMAAMPLLAKHAGRNNRVQQPRNGNGQS